MTTALPSVSAASPAPVRRALICFAFIVAAAAIGACSTTEGFGKDVKHLGGGIEDSAAKNK